MHTVISGYCKTPRYRKHCSPSNLWEGKIEDILLLILEHICYINIFWYINIISLYYIVVLQHNSPVKQCGNSGEQKGNRCAFLYLLS